MKNKQPATKSKFCVLAQVCNLIPGHLVSKLARKYGIETQARTFTAWSHVVAPLYTQLTHANRTRDSSMMEDLFWATLKHLQSQRPGFGLR